MFFRGLYGQAEGNESRNRTEQFEDRFVENEIAEGEWLDAMTRLARRNDLAGMGKLRDKMRETYIESGVRADLAQERADTVLRQGMGKLRLAA